MKKIFMIEKRKALKCTLVEMAKRCGCSWSLLEALENGEFDVTHPAIASRIAKEYALTVDEYNQLVHESHHVKKLPRPRAKVKYGSAYDAWRGGWGKKEGDGN